MSDRMLLNREIKDSYTARVTIEELLWWLRAEDGWSFDDLAELCDEAVQRLVDDEADSE